MSNTRQQRVVILETGEDGRSRFREDAVPLGDYKPSLYLSEPMAGGRVQLRHSPPGYWMDFHPSVHPQWTFVVAGELEIGLQDGSSRVFRQGDFFLSLDTVPPGETFNPRVHGHTARALGTDTIVTVLVRN